uniref:NDUFB7 n=1 Tax=Euglena gracilis TaxID=3039 RepID=UPI002FE4FA91
EVFDNELVSYEGVDWEKIPNRFKRRRMPLSDEVMDEWKIPYRERDYCVHKLLELRKCVQKTFYRGECDHHRHEYHMCQHLELRRRKAIKDLREELGR